MSGSFFDTNVLIYTANPGEPKSIRANELIRAGGSISVQTLNEFANVARKKLKKPWPEIVRLLSAHRAVLSVVPVSTETREVGLRIAERYGFSTYDTMIVAAALIANCDTLWSEDMQDGMQVDGRLTIRDPFRT